MDVTGLPGVPACDAPVPGGCGYAADRKGKCTGHYERMRRGMDMTSPVRCRKRPTGPCACGRAAQVGDKCRPCYQAQWKADKKAGRKRRDWFDWVVVERAWMGKSPLPRQLTNAERVHLLYFALQRGGYSPTALGDLVHMDPKNALRLAESIASGEVKVMGRNLAGEPTQALPAPVSAA